MTFETLLTALRRRWYIAVVGLAITGLLAVVVWRPQPLYWTQVDLVVVAPGDRLQDVPGDSLVPGMVAFAATVERQFNQAPVFRLSSPDAPIYGAGVRDGYSVVLPNGGNQWTNVFSRPVLSVEIVSPDPGVVAERFSEISQRVATIAKNLQESQGVLAEDRMTIEPISSTPTIAYVGSTRQQKARAIVVLVGLGVSLTAVCTDSFDRYARARLRPTIGALQR